METKGKGLVIGLAAGAFFGSFSDNLPFWVLIGLGIGIALESGLKE